MKKLRVAQYGFCHEHASGKMHTLRNFLQDEIDLVGIVDDRASQTPRFISDQQSQTFAGVPIITEEELFAPGNVDVVLVEATSMVDTEAEQVIQQALGALMRGRTTFIIAHRLSTVRDADKILVIDDGRIAESGDHATLMALQGRYHAMISRQLRSAADRVEL